MSYESVGASVFSGINTDPFNVIPEPKGSVFQGVNTDPFNVVPGPKGGLVSGSTSGAGGISGPSLHRAGGILNHSLLPNAGHVKPLAQENSIIGMKAYAASEFHVSVSAGLKASGTAFKLWKQAAGAYLGAFHGADLPGVSVELIRKQLQAANVVAAQAKSFEPKPAGEPAPSGNKLVEVVDDIIVSNPGSGIPTYMYVVAAGLALLVARKFMKGGAKRGRKSKRRRR